MVRPMATLLKMISHDRPAQESLFGANVRILGHKRKYKSDHAADKPGGVIASAAQGNWQVEEAAYNARDPRDQGTGGKTFCGCG